MNRPKNVSISLIPVPGGIKVWCASFTIKGSLPQKDGKTDEAARIRKEKEIQKILESLTFPEE